MKGDGFLAIWADLAPADETDYLHWLTREHIAERLDIPGFISARVYRAVLDQPRYMTLYWLRDVAVLSSAPYLVRLNNPTPWSQRTMPKWSRFTRGGGKVQFSAAQGAGGFAAPLFDPGQIPADRLQALAVADGITSVSLLQTDRAGTDIVTAEKGLRKRDESFNTLLLVEALSEKFLADALRSIGLEQRSGDNVYESIFVRVADAGSV